MHSWLQDLSEDFFFSRYPGISDMVAVLHRTMQKSDKEFSTVFVEFIQIIEK